MSFEKDFIIENTLDNNLLPFNIRGNTRDMFGKN